MLPKIAIKHCNLAGVGLVIAFRGGSIFETYKTNGLFHLCEHIILELGEREVGLQNKIKETGWFISAFTSKDCVTLYAKIPKINFGQALDYIINYLTFFPHWNIDRKQFLTLKDILKQAPRCLVWVVGGNGATLSWREGRW